MRTISSSANREIPSNVLNPIIHRGVHNKLQSVPTLSGMTPLHKHVFFCLRSTVILLSHLGLNPRISPRLSGFFIRTKLCLAYHMFRQSRCTWFHNPKDIYRLVYIMISLRNLPIRLSLTHSKCYAFSAETSPQTFSPCFCCLRTNTKQQFYVSLQKPAACIAVCLHDIQWKNKMTRFLLLFMKDWRLWTSRSQFSLSQFSSKICHPINWKMVTNDCGKHSISLFMTVR